MSHVRRFAATLAVALAMLIATSARAQVLQLVPSEAVVVIKIKNLQDVSAKIAALSQQWGLANIRPELNDPLGTLLTVGGLGPGLNKNGEAAVAIMMPAEGGDEPDVVVFVPVSDFKAFAGALPNAQAEGELTVFNPGGKPVYAASAGQFAAVSPKKELVTKKGAGLQVGGVAGKELASKDLIAYANLKALRPKLLPPLQQNKGQFVDQITQAMSAAPGANQKLIPVVKAYVTQMANMAEEFVQDAEGAAFGINLSKEGISTTLMAEFTPGGHIGKAVSAMKGGNASFTSGLPDGKYFVYGGFAVDPAGIQLFNDFVAPIEKEIQGMGAEGKPLLDYVVAVRDSLAATKQANFGLVAPPAAAIGGQQGVIQGVTIVKGDATKVVDAQRRMFVAQESLMKMMAAGDGANKALIPQTSNTPKAKTVDGVQLDQFTTKFAGNPQTPEEQQAAVVMQMLYGPNGMVGYTGAIGADKVVGIIGGDDALVTSAVQSAKSDADTLANGPAAAVSKALPQQRLGALFVPIDTIATTVLDVMAAKGMPGGVKLPPNLPPLGAALATEGSAFRVDGYVPAQTVQALIAAGMQMWMNMQGGGAGAGQPGGL